MPTRDRLVRIKGRDGVGVIVDYTDGTTGYMRLGVKSRMAQAKFDDVVAKSGVGGFALAYQMDETGDIAYLKRLKSAGEKGRVIHGLRVGVKFLQDRITLQSPWELQSATSSYNRNKLTVLITMLKPHITPVTGIDSVIDAMRDLIQANKSPSYTPKLIIADRYTPATAEVYATRDKSGAISLTDTLDYIRGSAPVMAVAATGTAYMIQAAVLRMSDTSAKKLVDDLLKAPSGMGKKNHVAELFFNTTVRGGVECYADGVVVSGAGQGYEYGKSVALLGHGLTAQEIIMQSKVNS